MTKRFSQNGWEAKPDTSTFVRETAVCKGGEFKFWAANADVALVFKTYVERYDAEVEDVVGPELDDWSYANRLVRGSATIVSNHGSATALDVNALKYPLGTTHMSSAKLSKIRAIRRAITDKSGRPVLRLGADYVGRKDQMHVEIDASAAKVKEAADRIRSEHNMALEKGDVEKVAKATARELLDTKLTLGESASRHLGKRYDGKDNVVSLEWVLQWGDVESVKLAGQVAELSTKLDTLLTEVRSLKAPGVVAGPVKAAQQ